MNNAIVRVDTQALSAFSKILDLANKAQEEQAFHEAEWFDTVEKRVQWWLDLEPEWQKAFTEAVFKRKRERAERYMPTDKELSYLLFDLKTLCVCGAGFFSYRNNNPDISFQLTNLSGVANLTNLTRFECDFNGQIASLEPLKNLKKMQVLWCDNNNISDLSPIMGLSNLIDLCCWNNQIRNLEPLASLTQLRSLALGYDNYGNPIEDPSPIKYLTELYNLAICACGITDLEFLRGLEKLRYIRIQNNNIASTEGFEELICYW